MMPTASSPVRTNLADLPPSARQAGVAQAPFHRLDGGMDEWIASATRALAGGLAAWLPDDQALLAMLTPEQREGSADHYVRHLVHADPLGRFSAMLLVWRPGQWSPVHGHRTWCAYRVLQGALRERHYRWDPSAGAAVPCGGADRPAGSLICVPAGLGHIHAFGNEGDAVAVSLHLYGVEPGAITTGINLPVHTA
ncbi:cysteine dioxygenase [Paracidovorax citrulli]